MKPYRSSSDKENCSPISSNCVVWQGPDISCINLCKGDSVSDVVYKLGMQICDFQNTASLSDLELDCILDICTSTPKPELTLAAVLQLVIDKICCSFGTLNSAITNINLGRPSGSSDEVILDLPPCLQYNDPITGLPVTTLPLSAYVVNMANQFCALKTTVDLHTSQISNLTTRVTNLEDAPCCYTPPTIIPNCSYGPVVAGVPTEMSIIVDGLDEQYCQLRTVLGTNTQLNSAAAAQCPSLGSFEALSQSGTMSSLSGWNNTVTNLGQSMQNLWITLCDMRAIMYDLKACCGSADCSAFFLNFTPVVTTPSTTVTLNFSGQTTIPAGFADCAALSTVTITDNNGHLFSDTFSLVSASTNPSGIAFNISTSGLDGSLPWIVTVSGCIIKSSNTCTKVVSNTIPNTTTTTTCPCTLYDADINATDLSNATGNTNTALNGRVFIDYYACGSTNVTTVSYVLAGPGVLGCSCSTPQAYNYITNVKTPVLTAGTVVSSGACV